MLFLVLSAVHSQQLPARTAIVFAGDIVSLSTPAGPRFVYGAYYPTSSVVTLATPNSSSLNATLTFPDYCSGIGLSNEPAFFFELPLSSGIPELPFVNICIWLHSSPANVSYSFRSVTNNTLQLEQVDGEDIAPLVLKPGDRFGYNHDVFLRWLILSPEESSFFQPMLRIEPSPDYVPEKTFSTFFVVSNDTVYFDPPPLTNSPHPSETPLASETLSDTLSDFRSSNPTGTKSQSFPPTTPSGQPSSKGDAVPIVVIALSGAGLLALAIWAFCCYSRYKSRKGGRPARIEELPADEMESP
jgi:hypothetical protein